MASKDSALKKRAKPGRDIAPDLLTWFQKYGRHDLPWQQPRNAYRVWVSEIMLQQTQVNTVIPYFERFMARFPDIQALANAEIDEVLHQWTGLGYYARARNLHKAAQQIRDQHKGIFPDYFDDILAMPGIGRSTAGAILAQAYAQRFAILDGNVKRVLTRLHAIEGWPGNKKIENQLWEIAEHYTPENNIVDYTQAIMDLGATVCTRSRPDCEKCPLAAQCEAYRQQRQAEFPFSKPKKALPVKSTCMLVVVDDHSNHILLEQRPPTGIWGGLWSFPECENDEEVNQWCEQHLSAEVKQTHKLEAIRHTFSHYHLDIQPVRVHVNQKDIRPDANRAVMDSSKHIWYNTQQPDERGLPAPIKTILNAIALDQL
jgi:A/G-specific adenine glycosylase